MMSISDDVSWASRDHRHHQHRVITVSSLLTRLLCTVQRLPLCSNKRSTTLTEPCETSQRLAAQELLPETSDALVKCGISISQRSGHFVWFICRRRTGRSALTSAGGRGGSLGHDDFVWILAKVTFTKRDPLKCLLQIIDFGAMWHTSTLHVNRGFERKNTRLWNNGENKFITYCWIKDCTIRLTYECIDILCDTSARSDNGGLRCLGLPHTHTVYNLTIISWDKEEKRL